MDATTIFNKNQCSVTLKKLAKSYGWDIKVYGDDMNEILKEIKRVDESLRAQFPA